MTSRAQEHEGPVTHLPGLIQATVPGRVSRLGIAVSGGGDSLALLLAAVDWARERGAELRAVTVDHALRPESRHEAEQVARICAGLDVAHDLLTWNHGAIRGNLQQAAREARYALIAGWARANGVQAVALGHTATDQAETLLMGLSRAAGIDGLSGMRPAWEEAGVLWLRPFLTVTRQDLRAFLRQRGQDWVDDPSNEDARFARVRARQILNALQPLGISEASLARVAENLARAREVVVRTTARAAADILTERAGALFFHRRALIELPSEVTRRILSSALMWLSGASYPPRAAEIERLTVAIADGGAATLAGCRVAPMAPNDIGDMLVARELRVLSGQVQALEPGWEGAWDRRWRLKAPDGADVSGLRVRAVGPEGLRQCPEWRDTGLPRAALIVTPAVWRKEHLVAAPVAGRPAGWTAEIVAPFAARPLSH
ncbi:tRNA(Ile)-lysidine synthase [Albidovulum inexpectatum]|uniref:tRNA(Ile)-lysidine synthase n=1 Tax=Albidovulum inexpectatum TaxID=196587 RepID=A0A2S5JGK2_9RHOB|nr:tRNA lysidine(34) synthetase TilS [Albidovulum inexpectatum]PPB80612.1 tRNA(Ile)-lysidine synthase [Albidovulum inexpectatum]